MVVDSGALPALFAAHLIVAQFQADPTVVVAPIAVRVLLPMAVAGTALWVWLRRLDRDRGDR